VLIAQDIDDLPHRLMSCGDPPIDEIAATHLDSRIQGKRDILRIRDVKLCDRSIGNAIADKETRSNAVLRRGSASCIARGRPSCSG